MDSYKSLLWANDNTTFGVFPKCPLESQLKHNYRQIIEQLDMDQQHFCITVYKGGVVFTWNSLVVQQYQSIFMAIFV